MPTIDLCICLKCYGTGTVIIESESPQVAAKLEPCDCGSGVEAITEDGEVLGIGKVEHEPQETQAENQEPLPPAG